MQTGFFLPSASDFLYVNLSPQLTFREALLSKDDMNKSENSCTGD